MSLLSNYNYPMSEDERQRLQRQANLNKLYQTRPDTPEKQFSRTVQYFIGLGLTHDQLRRALTREAFALLADPEGE